MDTEGTAQNSIKAVAAQSVIVKLGLFVDLTSRVDLRDAVEYVAELQKSPLLCSLLQVESSTK
jgi:hypothetical protein